MARRANRKKVRPQVSKTRKHETLEDRVVMSADPLLGGPMMTTHGFADIEDVPTMTHHRSVHTTVETAPVHDPGADFWSDLGDVLDSDSDELGQRIEQTLAQAHDLTGQDHVVSKYGFDGTGQTVAVLDTGIAYSHYALGGGLGDGYRVVGGYDFTENDSDFYDDGPHGGHGTHVAGIVGAQGDGAHSGVATGVDLVGLRVFDDAGNGYFSWVESALNWVYDNRNAFNNPITAINLSLGTSWNSDNIPSWAMLEDEFAKLENAGIFIAVSAGNSYQDYNANGVSYPAASDHVIPVMATYNSGSLANFSQRATYAIAAPGVGITSTVPDYAANDGDTIDDDWLGMSGTSMAAPYVAGASTLIREAMEFVGQTGVDQWDIYNHIMATSDSFFDSTSQTTYQRLNLEAAIDALMPTDDYGSTVAMAHGLGTINDGSGPALSGVISTLDDADHFSFTAGVTGTVTISASNVTHSLTSQWEAWGGTWQLDENGNCVIDVVAGQTYSFALSSSDGLGYYNLNVSLEASETFTPNEWGAIGPQETRNWQPVSGDEWFRVTAGRTGYFTAEVLNAQGGAAAIAVYDAQQNLISTPNARADALSTAGQELLIRVTGDAASYDVRMTNALSVEGGVATLFGTSAGDTVVFQTDPDNHGFDLNGVDYTISVATASSVVIDGAGGADSLDLYGDVRSQDVTLRVGSAAIVGTAYSLAADGFGEINYTSTGGADTAVLYGSAGADTVDMQLDRTVFTGTGFENTVYGVRTVHAYGEGGSDQATLRDSTGSDDFYAYDDRSILEGSGFFHHALGFERVDAYSTGGSDRARFYDTAGDEFFEASADHAMMVGATFENHAHGFGRVDAFATGGGNDRATFKDTSGDDIVTFRPEVDDAFLSSVGHFAYALGFDRVDALATNGGNDRVTFNDTSGNDSVTFRPETDDAYLGSATTFNYASGFDRVDALATNGGYDRVTFNDTSGDDNATFRPETDDAYLGSANTFNYASGFDRVDALATNGGNDRVTFNDTSGDDSATFRPELDDAYLGSANAFNYASGFDRVDALATNGGNDRVIFNDTSGSDNATFRPELNDAYLGSANAFNYASGFDRVDALATNGGSDRVTFLGRSDNQSITHRTTENDCYTSSDGMFAYAYGFEQISDEGTLLTSSNAFDASDIDPPANAGSIDQAFEELDA